MSKLPISDVRRFVAASLLLITACGGDGPTTDTSPPEVTSHLPAAGAVGVDRSIVVSATLSETVDPATASASTLVLSAAGSGPVPGEVTLDGQTITFEPDAPLAYGTAYSARISTTLADLDGNTLAAPFTWTFTTVENPPPTVLSTNPPEGARNVDPLAPVTATFSEPVAPATGFQLSSLHGDVAGTVTADGSTLTFTPASMLDMDVIHVARLTTAIRDLDGAALAATHGWTFRTAVNSQPEHTAAEIAVGGLADGEWIDVHGDVDEFRLSGNAGDEWVVFIQAEWPGERYVEASLVDALTGAVMKSTSLSASHPELEQWSTGRAVLPRTGAYIVRVSGRRGTVYRVRVDEVNRTPESAPADFAPGDTVSDAIDVVADIDEFTFSGVAGQEVSLGVQLQSGMSAGLSVDLLYGTTILQEIGTVTPVGSLDEFGTGRITLPATGDYTVRVRGPALGTKAAATGAYRLEVYVIDRAVEGDAAVAIDAGPITEAIERPGDVDEYSITGTAGQLFVLHLDAPARTNGELIAELLDASGMRIAAALTGGTADNGGLRYSRRLELPSSGTYRIRVQAWPEWSLASGPYALEAYTVSPAPEHIAPTVALGQIVSGELIDRPGDLDVFTFEGEEGREANFFLGWDPADGELSANLGHGIATTPGTFALDGQSTGRFPLKDSTYTVIVDSHWSAQPHMLHSVGEYAFRVFPIDRQPEGRATTFAVGDTISGEPLYPAGDIDEYVFEVPEQMTLDIFWETAEGVRGSLSDDITGAGIWSNLSTVNGELIRRLTLPAGHYRMSVHNYYLQEYNDPYSAELPTLTYRFALVPAAVP